jgi:hypothetical protein
MQPLGESSARPTGSSGHASALEVDAQIVGRIGERFDEHLLGSEIGRNLVCADHVRHEMRESILPTNNTELTLI